MVSREAEKNFVEPEVDLLVAFVNTKDVEAGSDAIADAQSLRTWVEEQTGEHLPELDDDDAVRLRALRESLRALLRTNNNGDPAADSELLPLREAADRSRYRAAISGDGSLSLDPARSDLSGFEARLLLAVERLQSHGAWRRLKVCTEDVCQWAFYDTTRNRSRTWCSMDVCGNREKTRRYRQRRVS
jgi:predicted RNA-binding Zn ribbon-like protein